jgi:hypothetical protein
MMHYWVLVHYGCGWRINFVAISYDVEYNSSSLIECQWLNINLEILHTNVSFVLCWLSLKSASMTNS